MWNYIIAIVIIVLVVGLYVFSYYWDSITEKPEVCDEDLECKGCKVQNCSHKK